MTLDLMRGYFIFIIIIDHMIRWPSIFAWVTGQGRLWVSAAEGFFIISGLLVGYTRGFKKRTMPFKDLTKLLLKRGVVLYICAVIATIILYFIAKNLSYPSSLQPMLLPEGASILSAIVQILTLRYVFEWVFFLKLYFFALLLAPIFIWLLRKQKFIASLILSLILWLAGVVIDYDWLQWQVLFFVPAIIGYNLEPLQNWWQTQSKNVRHVIKVSILSMSFITLVISSFWVFGWVFVENPSINVSFDSYVGTRTWLDPIFAKFPLSPARVLLSLLWFGGLFVLIRTFEQKVQKFLGWLLLPLGTSSLSAYILHGFVLVFIQAYVPVFGNIRNALISFAGVLSIWLFLKLPILSKVLPR